MFSLRFFFCEPRQDGNGAAISNKKFVWCINTSHKGIGFLVLRAEKAMKRLPAGRNIHIEPGILNKLTNYYGQEHVKVVEKPIEKKF